MQFSYEEASGQEVLEIKDDVYNYIIKARRHKIDDEIYFRNFKDNYIYLYKINFIDKKKAVLRLISKEEKIIQSNKKLHIAWCIIDPKNIEKCISFLNEVGVDKITFIYSEYSQKNFKINIEKLEKILINSSCQCGRSNIIKLEMQKSLNEFIKKYPDSYILDFSKNLIDEKTNEINTLIVGCEGGFSKIERDSFDKRFIVGFKNNSILRSETAVISAASKILL